MSFLGVVGGLLTAIDGVQNLGIFGGGDRDNKEDCDCYERSRSLNSLRDDGYHGHRYDGHRDYRVHEGRDNRFSDYNSYTQPSRRGDHDRRISETNMHLNDERNNLLLGQLGVGLENNRLLTQILDVLRSMDSVG